MSRALQAAFAATILLYPPFIAHAQTPAPRTGADGAPLQFVVTPERVPTAIQRIGSAVTVIGAEEIARRSPTSLVDVLRSVPGLEISEPGGPGSTATIRLRGANSGQTLVLLDGVRVNDPSGASGEFDTAMIAPGLIERIEVLRGPQSALYGSDAIGGVVNIITRRGKGAARHGFGVEAGSYGTLSAVGTTSGSAGAWNWAGSLVGQRMTGFSRYGYRIDRLERSQGPFEADGFDRFGGFGRIGYDPGNGFRLDLGAISTQSRQEYDAAFGRFPDTPSLATRRFHQVAAKGELDTFGGALTHSLQLFANRTQRRFRDVSYFAFGGAVQEFRSLTDFDADRIGAEYQGILRLGSFGTLIGGGRLERETADSFGRDIVPFPGPRLRSLAAQQETASAFALWQWPVGERLNLSLSGRYDHVTDAGDFPTWRATAAYLIPETATKLRASIGTGAKAATLFQRFSPDYGTATLDPERSTGADIGIDQTLFGGRATLSLTAFANRLRDMIDFEAGPRCRINQPFGCYVNVARATTSGVELSGRVILVDGVVELVGSYTYLHAKDRLTGLTLARRPQHAGRLSLEVTPLPGWLIEPSVTLASERFSSAGERNRLAPFARFDIHTHYAIDANWKVHARIENITDARYQEALGFGTTGRAFYAGLSANW